MKVKKKLIKVWGKIKLLETSAVGLPVYPYAHKSYSLIKALRETAEPIGEQLNMENKQMEESEEKSEDSTEQSAPEAEAEEPKAEEAPAEEKAEEKPAEEPAESVEKSMTKKDMMDIMTKGFAAAIKASQTERGLVSQEENIQKKVKEELDKKSIGELAMMNGLFTAPEIVGKSPARGM